MDTRAKPVAVSLTLVAPLSPAFPSSTLPASDEPIKDRATQDVERSPRYRLIIEEGPSKGTFVYKTLDNETGEIVRQFPREELVRLSAAETYAKGMVADTLA